MLLQPTTAIPEPSMNSPHVVILGAGASLAAMPNGDRNGLRIPLMNNLLEVMNFKTIPSNIDIDGSDQNFERLYSILASDPKYVDCVNEIEATVFDYFAAMQLPSHPTIYDHLVLSLREKDLIATFNWDPFLLQAVERLPRGIKPPHIRFLHVCVGVGYCSHHDPVTFGNIGMQCQKCGELTIPSRLLFPVTKKNYYTDKYSAANWRDMRTAMKNAYLLTVFGYSAPSTDVEAVSLLHDGWGEENRLGNIEIIDIRPEVEIRPAWESFTNNIPSSHFVVRKNFYSGWLAHHPRRSGEAFWNTRMQAEPPPGRPIPNDADWDMLHSWVSPLLEQEAIHEQQLATVRSR